MIVFLFRDCLKHQERTAAALTPPWGQRLRPKRRRLEMTTVLKTEEPERAGLQEQGVRGQAPVEGRRGGPERSVVLLLIVIVTVIVHVPLPLLSFERRRVLA